MADDRLIVALDVPDALAGLALAETLGNAVSFYKIGLGMLTGGGLALANELKTEHGKRIFLDMKLFDIGATVEAAVRGLSRFDLDFLTVHGDPQVVRMGDTWVMFYFGAFYRPGAFDTFACSRDLVHWRKWDGPDLVAPSEPWDKTFAHKPWVVKHDGVVYHFYCAVGDQGRVIALATSFRWSYPQEVIQGGGRQSPM